MVRGAGPSGAVSCPLHVNPESDVCFPSHTLSDVPGGARWLPDDRAGRGAGPRIRLTPLLVSLEFAFQRQGGREREGGGREREEKAAAQAGALSRVLKPRPARDRGPLRPAPHASALSRTTLPSASPLQATDLPEVYAQCGSVTAGRRAGCLPRRAEQQPRARRPQPWAHAGAESLGGKRTAPRGPRLPAAARGLAPVRLLMHLLTSQQDTGRQRFN